jgi:hypothetical protein
VKKIQNLFFLACIYLFIDWSFIVVLGGGTCGIYKCSYNVLSVTYLNSPSPSFFYSPSHHSWNNFSGYHFSIYTCVHSICTIFTLPCPFSTSSPLSLVPPPEAGLFHTPVLQFCNEKKDIFVCLR